MSPSTKHKQITGICIGLSILSAVPAMAATGGVSVGLAAYEQDQRGRRVPYEGSTELMPEESLSYILSLSNHADPVWIRLKVEYQTDSDVIEVGDSWLKGIDPNTWVKRGDYWYATHPLAEGEYLDFCSQIQVPDIEDLPDGADFRIISRGEAVQQAHVQPDFAADNPFDGILIDRSYTSATTEAPVSRFEIRYENGADNFIDDSGMFSDISHMMPGDTRSGTIKIRNTNQNRVRILLKELGQQVNNPLVKELQLTIAKDGKEIYHGAILDNMLVNGLNLGDFRSGSESTLTFTLHLPKTTANTSMFQELHTAWVFSAERVSSGSGGSSSSSSGTTTSCPVYSSPDNSVSIGYSGGTWHLLDAKEHRWEYILADGTKAKNGWLYLYNPYTPGENRSEWFKFNADGIMEFGWIKTPNGNWYFCHEISDGNLGRLVKGWHHDQDDGRTYYLDPVTGIMQSGWRKIDGNYYYFATQQEIPKQNWFWDTRIGRWIYDLLGNRTYGSMYRDEMTPDGYHVNKEGVWDGQEK